MEQTRKMYLSPFHLVALVVMTFAIPAMQWLLGKLLVSSPCSGLISSLVIVAGVCFWHGKTKAFSFLPQLPFWKVFCRWGGIIAFGLLIVNIWAEPVSKITRQARSSFEVIDVIILIPIAEELIFRGVMWSMLDKFLKNGRRRVVALVGTSLLFGVEHLGYWAQSHAMLPPDAIFHVLSMVAAGACFGAFRLASRSLVIPMIVHMLANGAILLTQ